MDRTFLEGLSLEKEVVEKIIAEHGKAVQAEQSKPEAERAKARDVGQGV